MEDWNSSIGKVPSELQRNSCHLRSCHLRRRSCCVAPVLGFQLNAYAAPAPYSCIKTPPSICPTTTTMARGKGPLLTSTFKDDFYRIMSSNSQQMQQHDDLTMHYTKNPNSWSKWRYILREPTAEFLGTMVLVLFGNGVNAQVGSMRAQTSSSNVMPSP